MTFTFYQPFLDLHQSALIRNLASSFLVTLVVEKEINEVRLQNDGFSVPDMGKAAIVIADEQSLKTHLEKDNTIHIFPNYTHPWLRRIKKKKQCLIGVYSESFRFIGYKRIWSKLKYTLFTLQNGKKIDFLLAYGSKAYQQYMEIGLDEQKIFRWIYFAEDYNFRPIPNDIRNAELDKPRLLFVGSIFERKNILELVTVCKKLENKFESFKIIGVGNQESELKEAIKECNKIEYLGSVSNTDIASLMSHSDLLILPSKYDAWGVVVNEALMCGIPVLTSNRCGAAELIQGYRGKVYSTEKNDMQAVLEQILPKLPYTIHQRQSIQQWAVANISAKTAMQYICQVIDYTKNKATDKPDVPWLRE